MKINHRLLRPEDFRFLLRKGRRVETPLFRLVYRPNGLSRARLAFVAPRALDKRATLRNLLRRRAREWARKNPEIPEKAYDTALFFKKESLAASRKKFYEELDKIFQHISHQYSARIIHK